MPSRVPLGAAVQVLFEGYLCEGSVVAHGTGRLQVQFVLEGTPTVRWFDPQQVYADAG